MNIGLDDIFAKILTADPVINLITLKCGSLIERNLNYCVTVTRMDTEFSSISTPDLAA